MIRLLNYDGSVRANYAYDAWGKILSVTDATGNEVTDPNHMGRINPIRYRGYYYDEETGLYYLQSRYYDPVVGRFLNADGVTDTNAGIIGYNLFAYAANNPIIYQDGSGHSVLLTFLVAGVAGALISSIASATTQLISTGTVNWAVVGVNAVSGFIGGLLSASCIGIWGMALAGSALGVATYTAESIVTNKPITAADTICSAVSGGVSGFIGGAGFDATETAPALSKAYKGLKHKTSGHLANSAVASRQAARDYKPVITEIRNTYTVSAGRYAAGSAFSQAVNTMVSEGYRYNSILKQWGKYIDMGGSGQMWVKAH